MRYFSFCAREEARTKSRSVRRVSGNFVTNDDSDDYDDDDDDD